MIFAANWKMNLSQSQAQNLAQGYRKIAENLADSKAQIIIFPPALYANHVNDVCHDGAVQWGGQNTHGEIAGAFTGDISAKMFASAGASWQLIGHSERRQHHSESDAFIAGQLQAGQEADLHIVLCVGESLADREAGKATQTVQNQLRSAMPNVLAMGKTPNWQKLTIAYEPIWAIGTGKVAEPADIEAMHEVIATICTNELGASSAPDILYGGSVKSSNAADILSLPHVSGALIGGASLEIADFEGIINAAHSHGMI